MKFRRGPWLVFGVCALCVGAALTWITVLVLRLERAEGTARTDAAHMESMRLALWRMDSWFAPRLARESARPYYEYLPYYPQPQAYTRIFNVIDEGEVITPSPLLTFESPYFKVHFQIDAQGVLTSPQVPQGNMRDVAESTVLTTELYSCNRGRLDEVDQLLAVAQLRDAAKLADVCAIDSAAQTLVLLPAIEPPVDVQSHQGAVNVQVPPQAAFDPQQLIAANAKQQEQRSQVESASRSKMSSGANVTYQTANPMNDGQTFWSQTREPQQEGAVQAEDDGNGDVIVGPLVPHWIASQGDDVQLVFLRQVVSGKQESYQGFLVDWLAMRQAMLTEVQDLLGDAKLQPVWSADQTQELSSRMLATVPVLLVADSAGSASLATIGAAWFTPARTVVIVTWLAAIVALLAVGITLHASIAYGQRRSRFASAVTHELRTPLTTFQMYSEMLAEGMVRSEEQRRGYLNTLRDESRRLATLVENILSYARLEEGRHVAQSRTMPLGELFEQVRAPLQRRADNAGMSLNMSCNVPNDVAVRADADIVGQILLNLVDNACKYAQNADGPCAIELRVEDSGGAAFVRFVVQDSGPGIDDAHAKRIFAPFDRGSRQEGDGTPGVGLGLALARGLARDLGGDLTLDQRSTVGARFVLTLPRA